MAFPRTFAVLAVASALVVGCGHNAARPGPSTTSSKPVAAPAPPVCGDPTTALPIRDKLAQLLMVGVKTADDARSVVNGYHVGGIFIGSWTDLSIFQGPLAQIAGSAGPLPLAVSVDEEGGRVSRLRSLIGTAPSARTLAQTQTPAQVHDLAAERGKKMHDLGITVDFAPVVDVTDEPEDAVIGNRSFGNDPNTVTQYAGAYAQGLRDAGVLPVLKHFPGHGHGSGDSHTGAVVTPPLSDLQNVDLVPYRTLVTAAPVAVMVGHLQVPGLTGDDPASLSRAAVQLLRDGIGYGGAAVQRPGVHRRSVQHGRDLGPLWRGRSGAAQLAGRCRRRVVGHHRRGARGAGPARKGGGRRRITDGKRGPIGGAGGVHERP